MAIFKEIWRKLRGRPDDRIPNEHTYTAPIIKLEPPLRPLPAIRPRGLTNAGVSHAQQQSPLITRIPVELRLIIWEYTIGCEDDQDVLHLDLADGILRYVRCFADKPCDRLGLRHKCWGKGAIWNKSWWDLGMFMECQPREGLRKIRSLLLTCKLLYTESVDILYQFNTFTFRRSVALIRLPSIMLPHRFQQIRRIRFSTVLIMPFNEEDPEKTLDVSSLLYRQWEYPFGWFKACESLASFNNLEDLQIDLVFSWSRCTAYDGPREEAIAIVLDPLKSVRATRFYVALTEPVPIAICKILGPVPFELFQRGKPKVVPRQESGDWYHHRS